MTTGWSTRGLQGIEKLSSGEINIILDFGQAPENPRLTTFLKSDKKELVFHAGVAQR
jgi:hypothetical protein